VVGVPIIFDLNFLPVVPLGLSSALDCSRFLPCHSLYMPACYPITGKEAETTLSIEKELWADCDVIPFLCMENPGLCLLFLAFCQPTLHNTPSCAARKVMPSSHTSRQRSLQNVMMATTASPKSITSNHADSSASINRVARAQRLKDLLLEKELRSEIETAEFALTLNLSPEEAEELSNPTDGAIDYEKLAEKLEKGLALIKRRQSRTSGAGEIMTSQLTLRLNETKGELEDVLRRVKGSMKGEDGDIKPVDGQDSAVPNPIANAAAGAVAVAGSAATSPAPAVNPLTDLMREDGSVDVDKAIEKGKDFAKFSGDLWERLSGKSPSKAEGQHAEHSSHSESAPKPVNFTAIDNDPAIRQLASILEDLEEELAQSEKERDRWVGVGGNRIGGRCGSRKVDFGCDNAANGGGWMIPTGYNHCTE